MHSADALAAGESAARLFGLGAWHETPLYTDRERAALALTDAATRFGEHGVPDDVYAAAREHFDERELTYLVGAIAVINMWNRLAITFQSTPRSARTRRPV
jgi:alkylhydroperoxidase family enzyme